MKKRIIILVTAILLLGVGVVGASSINGDFQGNPIVKLKFNGKTLPVEDVPAMIYNGRTMVPIAMLRQLGVKTTWDPNTYSVDVAVDAVKEEPKVLFNPIEKTKEIITNGGGGITLLEIGKEITAITYFSSINGFDDDWTNIIKIIEILTDFGGTYSRVVYDEGGKENVIEINSQTYKDFLVGKITESQLTNSWILSGPLFETTTQNSNVDNKTSNELNTPIIKSELYLYSNDGKTYLGKLTSNIFDLESIFNEFGTHGSKFSTDSIWNEFGTYGGKFSLESAFNEFSTNPPIIVENGKNVGYLTINSYITGAVSPLGLLKWLQDNGY